MMALVIKLWRTEILFGHKGWQLVFAELITVIRQRDKSSSCLCKLRDCRQDMDDVRPYSPYEDN